MTRSKADLPEIGAIRAEALHPVRGIEFLKAICATYFKGADGQPMALEDFHAELLQSMFRGGQYVYNIPTDHMKSVASSFLFPLLSLMDDPNETHIICGANLADSKRRVRALLVEIETNAKLRKDYPWIAKPTERENRQWSVLGFTIAGRTINKPNPSVMAGAIGSDDIKGRRGKLIMDDIEGADARNSPTIRAQLYDFIALEAWRCYEDEGAESPRPLMIALGTPFDVDSIYFKLERLGWKTKRMSAYIQEYDENGKWAPIYLWPRKRAKVEKARQDMRKKGQFAIQYRMDPTGGDASKFSSEQLLDLAQEAVGPAEGTVYVSLDPASGSTSRQADYAGITVAKVLWVRGDDLPRVELLEAHRFTEGLFEQVDFCAGLSAQYNAPVIYEANSQQGGNYRNAFSHLHPETPLIRHYTSNSAKYDTRTGLSVIKTLFKEKRLHISEAAAATDGVEAFVDEIRDLTPGGTHHDHIAASLWFIFRKAWTSARTPTEMAAWKPSGVPANDYAKALIRGRLEEAQRMLDNATTPSGRALAAAEVDRLRQEQRIRQVGWFGGTPTYRYRLKRPRAIYDGNAPNGR